MTYLGWKVRNLRHRLFVNFQGKLILHSIDQGVLNRRQLAKFLIEEKLSADVNMKITRKNFEDMVEEIIDLVPTENREIYYVPSRFVDGRKMSCKGILYDNYCNNRKKFIKLGLIQKGHKM
ncbi:unnamed protein product [Phaedon cochleariae]|uniref:Uncharacterized protein n=1 Tax=Phaedon cochleariae TaxID=80249 RepID=A0A9P0DQR4_PHACE|nr:unnamed protein product [Phaedon cochleariae]